MLGRNFTLNTKECNYISHNHKFLHTDDFVIFFINQYPNRKFHQNSIQLSSKLAKSSVHRHVVKRQFMDLLKLYIYKSNNLTNKFFGKYLRIPKKEGLSKFANVRILKDKLIIKNLIKKLLESNIQQFYKKINVVK